MSVRGRVLLTLTVLITVVSLLFFQVLNRAFNKKIMGNSFENVRVMLTFLNSGTLYMLSQEGGKLLLPLLGELADNHDVRNAVLFDSSGTVKFNARPKKQYRDGMIGGIPLVSIHQDTIFQVKKRFEFRALMVVENGPRCYRCHGTRDRRLGHVMLDFNMHELQENMALLQNFGIGFTAFLLIAILLTMLVIHYRFVKRSLKSLKSTISEIESGNLDERVHIDSQDELGHLALSFNSMLDRLQEARQQIAEYHRKEIRNKEKMATVGEMASAVAHEIKNPLTGIANAMELIVSDINDETSKPVLEEIQRQVQRVNTTINSLLRFAKPTELFRQPEDLNKLLKNVVFFFRNQFHDDSVKITLKLDDSMPVQQIDFSQIEAALINLIKNGIQALDEQPGSVEIRSAYLVQQNVARITITDNGRGMPANEISKILKPFYSTRSKGTGLGLAITNDIIAQHHGTLRFESTPGAGTTVTIDLPVNERLLPPQQEKKPEA